MIAVRLTVQIALRLGNIASELNLAPLIKAILLAAQGLRMKHAKISQE